jgi:uncharacterized membrane protein YhaH (DUF805 family)
MNEVLQNTSRDQRRPNWLAGRSSRKEYAISVALVVGGTIALSYVYSGLGTGGLVGAILVFQIRRFHDLGRTGWFAVLLQLAMLAAGVACIALLGEVTGSIVGGLINIAGVVALGLAPGQSGDNRFGPPPGRKLAAEAFN